MLEATIKDMQETAALYVDELADKWSKNEPLPESSMQFIKYARREFSWGLSDCLSWLRDYVVGEHLDELKIMGYKHYGHAAISRFGYEHEQAE
jgi:hypothetical protein